MSHRPLRDRKPGLPLSFPISFGRYRLLELLGQGSRARVFKGDVSGPSDLTRVVAVKVLSPVLTDVPEFVHAFRTEARLGSRVSSEAHPNIVRLEDLGEQSGHLFVAMEYVPGFSLKDLLAWCFREGSGAPPGVALHVAAQLCKGLQFAHGLSEPDEGALHLVHGDLKPSNVLVSRFGQVKIADFGPPGAAPLTGDDTPLGDAVLGPLGHMSPEQARGIEIDHRSDLFCVGILLYELLTGEPLYDAQDEAGVWEAMRGGPAEGRLDRLPDLEGRNRVGRILAQALETSPDRRFGSAAEMLSRLDAAAVEVPRTPGLAEWLEGVERAGRSEGDGPDLEASRLPTDEEIAPEPWIELSNTLLLKESEAVSVSGEPLLRIPRTWPKQKPRLQIVASRGSPEVLERPEPETGSGPCGLEPPSKDIPLMSLRLPRAVRRTLIEPPDKPFYDEQEEGWAVPEPDLVRTQRIRRPPELTFASRIVTPDSHRGGEDLFEELELEKTERVGVPVDGGAKADGLELEEVRPEAVIGGGATPEEALPRVESMWLTSPADPMEGTLIELGAAAIVPLEAEETQVAAGSSQEVTLPLPEREEGSVAAVPKLRGGAAMALMLAGVVAVAVVVLILTLRLV